MKLGIANRIVVLDSEQCLADTQDVLPRYYDVVLIFQANDPGADSVAQAWLDHMYREAA